jgi:hypothetical protein
MSTALVRCFVVDVEVESPGHRFVRTYPALKRHNLVDIRSDLTTRWGRSRGTLYRPTVRGLAVITADEPRFLAARGGDEGDPGYTTHLADAVWDEPEAIDRVMLEVYADRGRLHDNLRQQDRNGHLLGQWAAVNEEMHELVEAANSLGIDVRSDIRTIKARLSAIEVKIRKRAA